jgi:hypothetical protein
MKKYFYHISVKQYEKFKEQLDLLALAVKNRWANNAKVEWQINWQQIDSDLVEGAYLEIESDFPLSGLSATEIISFVDGALLILNMGNNNEAFRSVTMNRYMFPITVRDRAELQM